MNYKLYWQIRKIVLSIIFFFKKQQYRNMKQNEAKLFTRPLSIRIAKTVFSRIISSSALVFLMLCLDALLISKANIESFDVSLYKDLLLGGMGIAGVILGLYCANIASIFSSKYTNVPKQISHDFQNDIITKGAIKEIIGYIVTCILTLMLCIAEFDLTWVSLSIIAILTVKMVVVFSVSGTRTYILSDSFRIADTRINNIDNAIKKIGRKDWVSSDASFQHHIQKQCESDISALWEIAKFNSDIPISQNSSICEFMENNLLLIAKYWKVKKSIPYNSKWFAESVVYPQWHTTPESQTSIALRLGISINSDKKPNHWWFEDELLAINKFCLDKLIRDLDVRSIAAYVHKLALLSSDAVDSHSGIYWVRHVASLQKSMLAFAESKQNSDFNTTDEMASIMEALAVSFIEVLKAESTEVLSLNIEKITDYACTVNGNLFTEENYYPFFNNAISERLYRQITAEINIEGKRITPAWFIKQTLAQQIYIHLGEVISSLEIIVDEYIKAGQQLHERKFTFCAAVYLSHYFAIINLCGEVISSINEKLSRLEQLHREKSYVWDTITTQKTQVLLSTLNKKAPHYLIRNCGAFSIRNWDNRGRKPDFLGLCYNHFCEHLIRSIETNDYNKFESIYDDFFSLTILYQEYVRSDVTKRKEPHLQGAVAYAATDPFVEYGMISGLATLWGEFISDDRWRLLVQKALDNFVKSNPETYRKTIESIVQIIDMRRSLFVGITGRSIMQSGWEIRVAQAVSANELFQVEYQKWGQKTLKTKSDLLKTFVGGLIGDSVDFHHVEDIYCVVFLNQYLDEDKKYKSHSKWEEDLDK